MEQVSKIEAYGDRSQVHRNYSYLEKKNESVSCSIVSDSVTLWTVACQAPLSMEFSRQEY